MAEYAVNENGCWVWLGRKGPMGYGTIYVDHCHHDKPAHRVFYERAKGPIPTGLVIDHLCRNILCVNPDHLEAVTSKENVLRGIGPTALNSLKTHCPKGHPYEGDNLRIRRGYRECRACEYERDRKRRKRRTLPPPGGTDEQK